VAASILARVALFVFVDSDFWLLSSLFFDFDEVDLELDPVLISFDLLLSDDFAALELELLSDFSVFTLSDDFFNLELELLPVLTFLLLSDVFVDLSSFDLSFDFSFGSFSDSSFFTDFDR